MPQSIDGISVRIEGQDRDLRRAIERSKKNVRSFDRSTASASRGLSTSFRNVAIASAAVTASVAAAAVAFRSFLNSSLELVGSQAAVARSLDTTIESIQILTRAAELTGVEIDDATSSFEDLTRAIGEAREGAGGAFEAFLRLGIGAEELEAIPTLTGRLEFLANRLHELNLPASDVLAVLTQMGVSSVEFTRILDNNGEAIKRARSEVERFGLALSEADALAVQSANKSLSVLGLAVDSVQNQLAVTSAPYLEIIAQQTANLISDTGFLKQAFDSFFSGVISFLFDIGRTYTSLFGDPVQKEIINRFDQIQLIQERLSKNAARIVEIDHAKLAADTKRAGEVVASGLESARRNPLDHRGLITGRQIDVNTDDAPSYNPLSVADNAERMRISRETKYLKGELERRLKAYREFLKERGLTEKQAADIAQTGGGFVESQRSQSMERIQERQRRNRERDEAARQAREEGGGVLSAAEVGGDSPEAQLNAHLQLIKSAEQQKLSLISDSSERAKAIEANRFSEQLDAINSFEDQKIISQEEADQRSRDALILHQEELAKIDKEGMEAKLQRDKELRDFRNELVLSEQDLDRQREIDRFEEEIQRIREYGELKLITKAEIDELEIKAAEKLQSRLTEITQKHETARMKFARATAAGKAKSVLDFLNKEIQGVNSSNKTIFKIQQALAIASAVVNTHDAATRALRDYPAPYSYAIAAAVTAAGFARIASIKSATVGGGGGSSGGGGGGSGGPFQGGTGVASLEQPQEDDQPSLDIRIQGISPSDLFTGEQVQGILDVINEQIDDGATIRSVGVAT